MTNEILKKNHSNYRHDKRLQQLMHVLKDDAYWSGNDRNSFNHGSRSTYLEFIVSMKKAIIGGRKITSRMEKAMKGIVIRYLDTNDPARIKKKDRRTELLLEKISKVGIILTKAGYSTEYTSSTLNFLNSVTKQAKLRGSITYRQKLALNKMYKRFNKRVEKNV